MPVRRTNRQGSGETFVIARPLARFDDDRHLAGQWAGPMHTLSDYLGWCERWIRLIHAATANLHAQDDTFVASSSSRTTSLLPCSPLVRAREF